MMEGGEVGVMSLKRGFSSVGICSLTSILCLWYR
jgi:hypothetical protein